MEIYEKVKYNHEVLDQYLPFCPEQQVLGRLRRLTLFYFHLVTICRIECLHASSWEGDGCSSKNGATMRKGQRGLSEKFGI